MRKVITMLLFVATSTFATSCDVVEDILDLNDEIEYSGEMIVSAYGVTAYTDSEAEFTLTIDNNEASILMKDIKFSDYMPYALDIQISDMPISNGTFTSDEIIPTVSYIPMEDYTMTNVWGSYTDDVLTMTFECMGCDVEYVGYRK